MSRLDTIKWNVHTPFQNMAPETTSTIAKKLAIPCHLMLFNLDGNMNIAMSVRTASVFGCSDVWIVGRRKYDARPEVGAKHYIRVHKCDSIDDDFFIQNGLTPFLLEQGGIPIEEMNFKPLIRDNIIPCFVMGCESTGLPDTILSRPYPRLTISQYGLLRSLNVSIAGSIVIYEYLKQLRETSTIVP